MAVDLLNRKLEYWEHQLLDLGKRNKMINYRETKRTTIKLVEPSFGELFNRLAINEETLTFQRSVDRETDIRVFSILSLLENLSAPLPVTIGDIKTEGSALERQRTLKNLRAKSRLALEEQGTNKDYSLSLERLNYFVNNNPWDGLSVRVSGFEYTEQMRAELEAFTNSIDDCIDVLTTINELPDICDQAQYISILEIAELIENICDLPQIPEIWLGAFDFEQGIKSASDAKNTYTKLYDLREAISKVFVDTIYHYNYNEWKEKLLAQANGFVDLPLISRKDSVFFVKEAVALHVHFTNLKNALMDAKNTYKAINEKLGTDFATNAYNQQTVVSLFDLIRSNVILNKIWFSSDIAKIRTLVIEAQAVANDIKATPQNTPKEKPCGKIPSGRA